MLKKIDLAFINAKRKVTDFLTKKHNGFDGLIIAIGLILVAMIVIVVFKLKIQPTMENAVNSTGNTLDSVINELTTTTGSSTGIGTGG